MEKQSFIRTFWARFEDRLENPRDVITLHDPTTDEPNESERKLVVDEAGQWVYVIHLVVEANNASVVLFRDETGATDKPATASESMISWGNPPKKLHATSLCDMLISSLGNLRKEFARPGVREASAA